MRRKCKQRDDSVTFEPWKFHPFLSDYAEQGVSETFPMLLSEVLELVFGAFKSLNDACSELSMMMSSKPSRHKHTLEEVRFSAGERTFPL